MPKSTRGVGSLEDRLGDAANVLVLAPTMTSHGQDACVELCSSRSGGNRVLLVTFTQTPDEWLDAVGGCADRSIDELRVVTVGDMARSAGARVASSSVVPESAMQIETVKSPSDLTGMGVKLSAVFSEWEGVGDEAVVCFRSLTSLLQYVDIKAAYRFLHVLSGQAARIGARAHYHMDPGAHDDQAVETMKTLFDAVIEIDSDGGVVVVTR